MTDICISRYKPSQFRDLGEILGIVLVYVASESFPAFWPRSNWSESKEKKHSTKQGVFALAPIYSRSECGKALRTGSLATQARKVRSKMPFGATAH